MSRHLTPIDISTMPDLARIVEEVAATKKPRELKRDNQTVAVPTPSPEDISFTEQCVEAGKLLDIELLDHLVIGHSCFLSLKERLRWQ